MTSVIQRDEEKVSQRFDQELADVLDVTVGEIKKADDYPMPDGDGGLV